MRDRRIVVQHGSNDTYHWLDASTAAAGPAQTRARTRAFSTGAPTLSSKELQNSRDLNHATYFVLNAKRNPLGSMSKSSWDDTTIVMSGWLPLDESTDGPDALKASRLSGYKLDSVERLLQRLIFEQATTKQNSALRNDRDLVVAKWQYLLVNGWIHLSKQQNEPAMIAATAERAELALGRIVDWYNRGGCWIDTPDNQDSLPVSAFVSLVQEWLRMGNPEGTVRATALLISWTDGEGATSLLEAYKDDVATLFNKAMKQSTDLLIANEDDEDLEGSTTVLANRLDLLRESGWENLDEINALARKITAIKSLQSTGAKDDNDDDDDIKRDEESAIAGPEDEAFLNQMTELIAAADKTDYDTIVSGAIPRILKSKNIPIEIASDIGDALVDYFIKVKDPKQATNWLQRLDQIRKSIANSSTQLDRYLAVIDLWLQEAKLHDEALWRADEILQHCEKLQRDAKHEIEGPRLEPSIYVKLLRMWATNTIDADISAQKVHKMLVKLMQFSPSGKLDDLTAIDVLCILKPMAIGKAHKGLSQNELNALVDVVKDNWDDTPGDVLEDTLEALVKVLETHKMRTEIKSLLTDFALADEHRGGESDKASKMLIHRVLSLRLPGMTTKSRVELIGNLGGLDDDAVNVWDMKCYHAAIPVLLRNDFGDEESFDLGKRLLGNALKRVVDEDAFCTQEALENLLVKAVTKCQVPRKSLAGEELEKDAVSRAVFSEEVLSLAEEKLLSMNPEDPIRKRFSSSPIPAFCFRRVMFRLSHAKELDKAEAVFVRRYDYFRKGGYDSLLPDRTDFVGYIDLKYKNKRPGFAKEMDDLLQEWLDRNNNEDWTDVYVKIIGAYKHEKDEMAALEYIEKQLQAVQASAKATSMLVSCAIRLANSNGFPPEKRYELTVKKYYQTYVMDKERNVELDSGTWKAVLGACAQAPAGEEETAMKLALEALTAIRRSKETTGVRIYKRIGAIISKAYPAGGQNDILRAQVAKAVFESCREDGCLTKELKNAFEQLF